MKCRHIRRDGGRAVGGAGTPAPENVNTARDRAIVGDLAVEG
jgi:hypothetical protein